MKLDKLLALCPLVEDLKVQFALLKEENTHLRKSLQWSTDEAKDLKKIQNQMKTELDETKSKLFTVDQQLQKQTMRNIKIIPNTLSVNCKLTRLRCVLLSFFNRQTRKKLTRCSTHNSQYNFSLTCHCLIWKLKRT